MHPSIARAGASLRRRGLIAVVLLFFGLLPLTSRAATIVGSYGTGSDYVWVTFESPNIGSRTYQVFFTYDAAAEGYDTFDGYDALSIIDAGDSLISFNFSNEYGSPEAPNYFMAAVTFNGETETGTVFPEVGPYWAQWVAGGLAGYPTGQPVSSTSWTFGSGMSAPYRILTPGSNEAWVFTDSASPSIAPIPEPGAMILAVVSAMAMRLRRRR